MESDYSWMVPIEFMVGCLDHGEVQACSICRIQDELREPKSDAYVPKLVSVGPLHRGATRHLVMMEEPKWRYLKNFLERQGSPEENVSLGSRLINCGADILKLDTVICASYGGDLELETHELSKIMIVDGCFLLELLLRLDDYMSLRQEERSSKYANDPFFETEKKVASVLNDITMMENQIPFVVLKKLFRKVYRDGSKMENDHRVANLVSRAFGYPAGPLQNNSGTAHILHLMHSSTVEHGHQIQTGARPACQELKQCATRLLAAGISIIPAVGNCNCNCNRNGSFVDKFDFDIRFNTKDAVLEIPPLRIKESTEVRWRNLIAWEQSRIRIRCKYTSYALFFRGLICCKHDIGWLEKKGMIVNESNMSKEELLTMFRSISKGVEHMDSSYSELCVTLNEHRVKRVTQVFHGFTTITWHNCRRMFEVIMFYWSNWYHILISEHIPTVWKFMGVVAAIVLLVLTIMQTYYSARSSG
ncbi:UPF0481 protein At3g47200-like [Arachis ipaensis]|uniref:Uncharacterized protein n=3 Tax=Arachis hypogaea TaxID=3818 RepID=A0A445AK85_ARAHY|nr:UPF0481 protein At3g47200-like [Arachis ipaensis]XP_025636285.1 UPF0481 protein At3g47200 [Arachis hypogaea]RYR26833.1 hypothetical protein Ahy_B02g061141 isoform A [Arachis hypogaea]